MRSQVRRPQKEGVTVRFGPDQVAPFFEVFARHMRDLGTPDPRAAALRRDRRGVPGQRVVRRAPGSATGRSPAGAGFAGGRVRDDVGLRAPGVTAASRRTWCSTWSVHGAVHRRGVQTFNFGRCTPGSGTHRFKRQWGGGDEPLWWYQHAAGRAATPVARRGEFSWGPKVWKRLPVTVATMLGPRIVRYIP